MKTEAITEAAKLRFMHGTESQHTLPEKPPDRIEGRPLVNDVAIKTEPTPNAMTSQRLHTFDGLPEICGIVVPTLADHSTPANDNRVKIEPTADLATPQFVHSSRSPDQPNNTNVPSLVKRRSPVKDIATKASSTPNGTSSQLRNGVEILKKPSSSTDAISLKASTPTQDGTVEARSKVQDDSIVLPKTMNVLPTLPIPDDAIGQIVDEPVGAPIKCEPTSGVSDSQSPETIETSPSFSRASDLGLEDHEVPTDPKAILTYRYHYQYISYNPSRIIAIYIAKLSRPESLEERDLQVVYDILKSLSQLTYINSAIEQDLGIRYILNGILGENPLKKRPYTFPDPFPADAAVILDRIEQELGYEEVFPEDPYPSLPTSPIIPTKKRKRSTMSASVSVKRRNVNRENINPNAREYGGMLHNLLVTSTGFAIRDKSLAVSCHRFGDNGLKVGDWWPFQVAAVRDGAHGASMAGIAGGQNDGAKSIVVGGSKYEGMDRDLGDTIYYSGSNSHVNTDSNNPILSNSTKALTRSKLDYRKVRVIRKAGGSSRFSPSAGLRYDGLYRVIDEEHAFNDRGGAYMRFKLQRCDGQDPIDTSRPTREEREALRRWRESI